MKHIPLFGGGFAVVDDGDYEALYANTGDGMGDI